MSNEVIDVITIHFREPLRSPITRSGKDIFMYELDSHTIFKDGKGAMILSVVTFELLFTEWGTNKDT